MLESTEIIVQLKRDIIKGKMNLQNTKDRISELEAQYGQDFFIDCDYDEAKPKPWDEEYLRKLEIKSMTGMSSKQFILHLAEVSEEVHSKKSNKKSSNSTFLKKCPVWIFALLAIIFTAVSIAIIASEIKSNLNEKVQNKVIYNETAHNREYWEK